MASTLTSAVSNAGAQFEQLPTWAKAAIGVSVTAAIGGAIYYLTRPAEEQSKLVERTPAPATQQAGVSSRLALASPLRPNDYDLFHTFLFSIPATLSLTRAQCCSS